MNYEEALCYLDSLSRFGMHLGLSRIAALLDKLGNPQEDLTFVHIAGTNGKGSVSSMLANILTHSGRRTGLFLSPYVLCFRERMQIDGQMISEEDFSAHASLARHWVDALAAAGDSPTQFELETAIAFLWYRQCGCDIVCLEVGLGGRFDASNVIAPPALQIITAIGLDHTAILGDSIEEIAFEKAGIIKGGSTILYPLQEAAARAVVQAKCDAVGSLLISPNLAALHIHCAHWLEGSFSYEGILYHKSLPGMVQVYNCLTVIEAAKQLQRQGHTLTEDDIRFGMEHTSIPARMELLSRAPLVILDGAHNPDGARALEATLQDLAPRPITLLMGLLADKDGTTILKTLAPHAACFIALSPKNPRALPAQELAQMAAALCPRVLCLDDEEEALRIGLEEAGETGALVICGSLYLASSIRPLLLRACAEQATLDARQTETGGEGA